MKNKPWIRVRNNALAFPKPGFCIFGVPKPNCCYFLPQSLKFTIKTVHISSKCLVFPILMSIFKCSPPTRLSGCHFFLTLHPNYFQHAEDQYFSLFCKGTDGHQIFWTAFYWCFKILTKQDQGSKAPSAVHYITVKALTKLSSKLLHAYNFLP